MEKLTAFGKTDTTNEKVSAAFGIDLGTTNSAIAVVTAGEAVETITLSDTKKKTMPSCVMWTGNGREFIVGQKAYENREKEYVCYSVKSLMQDPSATVTFKRDGKELVMTPIEVSAEILKGLVEKAGTLYGEIKDVVITVPAYFNIEGVSATQKAAELAGLNCLGILREPTSAAICYKLDKEQSVKTLVYDLGGGTFDGSLVAIQKDTVTDDFADMYGLDDAKSESNGSLQIQVLDVVGDAHLGGDDYDKELYKLIIKKIQEKHGYFQEEMLPAEERERLVLQAEHYKKLGVHQMYEIPYELHLPTTILRGEYLLTQQDFIDALEPVYNKANNKIRELLDRVEMCNQPDSIVTIGGSTKSPILQARLKQDFPSLVINNAYNPDESVAQGAAIHAKRLKFGDSSVQVFDVLPISLGIKAGDKNDIIISRGNPLPVVKQANFTTSFDNQDHVTIEIYQGDSPLIDQCAKLGTLVIDGIKPAKAGTPRLQVRLSLSADSILTCYAVIDGIEREISLSLNKTREHNHTKEDKQVKRWLAFANSLEDDKKKTELLELIKNYPLKVTRSQIVNFISEERELENNASK